MKRLLAVLLVLVTLPVVALAAAAESAAPTGGNWGAAIWAFANTPLGITIIITVISTVLGWVFTKKPKWKALVLQYGPKLMQAVKAGEKKIPDDTPNKGMRRLDEALKFLIQLEPSLYKVPEKELKAALTAVHTSAEANGNLSKPPAEANGNTDEDE